MEKKIISLTLLLIILILFPFVTAEVMNVACAKDSDCGNGEVCQKVGPIENWECVKTTGDPYLQGSNPQTINNQTDYTPIVVAGVIIGVCIIVGFIILAIILRKKRK